MTEKEKTIKIQEEKIIIKDPVYKIILFNLFSLAINLKLIEPEFLWEDILYQLLVDHKEVVKDVKAKKVNGKIILDYPFKIEFKEQWWTDYVYFNKPFSKEKVPEELEKLYFSESFEIFYILISDFLEFLLEDYKIYPKEKVIHEFLTFLKKLEEIKRKIITIT